MKQRNQKIQSTNGTNKSTEQKPLLANPVAPIKTNRITVRSLLRLPSQSDNSIDDEPNGLHTSIPWGPWTAVLYGVFVFFAAQIAAIFVVAIYPKFSGWGKSQSENWLSTAVGQFWYVLVAEILTFCAIWWFVTKRKSSLHALGWQRPRLSDVAKGAAGFGVYFVAYLIIFSLINKFVPQINVNQQQDIGFQNVYGNLDLTLTFISVVVLPPLVEETVFRGFIFQGMRRRMTFVWAAVITSLLFAAPHALESSGGGPLWIGAIDTATLSLALCYLREKTGSLWPGIFAHALKNGIAFYVVFILQTR